MWPSASFITGYAAWGVPLATGLVFMIGPKVVGETVGIIKKPEP